MKTFGIVLTLAVLLSGCATRGYRLGDASGSPVVDGAVIGGGLGAGLGAIGCAVAGIPPAACAKVGAVVGGGAGIIYGATSNGRPSGYWGNGGVVYTPQPQIVVVTPPPAVFYPPRAAVVCQGALAREEQALQSNPYGASRWVKTGRVICEYPDGSSAVVTP